VLATAFWETARTMRPVREYGGETYLRTKKYYPYVGMGYVQLTWKANYEKAGRKLGVDFVKNPKLLLEPRYAAPILVAGMKDGWFTGRKLADYITLQKSDFTSARRIVNGTDKAATIAAIAREYDAALRTEGYGVDKPATSPADLEKPAPSGSPSTKNDKAAVGIFTLVLAALGAAAVFIFGD